MKYFTSLFIILPFMALLNWHSSPVDPEFDRLWSTVENLQKKGLPNAASEVVDDIITLAEAKDVRTHWIKGIQFKANFIAELEEQGDIKSMDYLEKMVAEVPNEVQSLVHITLAEKYQFYVRNQFYRLNNRTNISGGPNDDKSAWSAGDFESAATDNFLKALANKSRLLKIETKDYETIINIGENSIHLTPTLYDFIAHQALKYLTTPEKYSIEGIQDKPVDWNVHLRPYKDFINYDHFNNEGNSIDHLALQIYTDLLSNQNERKDKNALIYTELSRLDFIRTKLNTTESNSIYEEILNGLLEDFSNQSESPLINQLLANLELAKANDIQEKSEAGKLRIRAHELLSAGIARHPKSYGAQQCKQSLNSLESPQLHIVMEKAVPINQTMLMHVDHKELNEIRVRIGKMSREEFIRFKSDHKYRKNIESVFRDTELQLDRSIDLVDNKNYTSYSSEFMLEGLPSGIYLVFVQNEEMNIKSYQIIHSTDMAFAHASDGQTGTDIFVFNRISGKPMQNVEVKLFAREYGRSRGKLVHVATGITNRNGKYNPGDLSNRSVIVELSKNEDRYIPYENIYLGRSYREPQVTTEATILTDRAIYRPGQDIHYKIIVYQKDRQRIPSLLENKEVIIELVNPNGKVEASIPLTTNEFGSASGIMKAPEHGIKGHFTLRLNGIANRGIRIEEYKRPKFKVSLEIPEGEMKGGQLIEIPGLAESFAGVALENATVKYKVVRVKQYRYFWWYEHGPQRRDQGDKLIAIGHVNSDTEGNFTVPFTPILEKEDNTFWRPIYIYKVTADVTDENGETRTGSIDIRVGSEPYYIRTNLEKTVDTEVFKSFLLFSENAMGEPAQSSVQIDISAIRQPEKPKVNRLWALTDYSIKDKKKFEEAFPQYNYDKPTDYSQWEEYETVSSNTVELNGEYKIELNDKLLPGVYKVVVRDKNGDEKYTTFFTSYSFTTASIITKDAFVVQMDKKSYQPGEVANVLIHSPFNNSNTLVIVEKNRSIISEEWYALDENRIIKIPIREEDRGGFIIRLLHVTHNRMVNQQLHVKVPWTNKKLNISWETFRDKLLPGQNETWRLTISGPDKESVMAEAVAGMYDASLDEFVAHKWGMDLFPTYYSNGRLSLGGFGVIHGNTMYNPGKRDREVIRRLFPSWKYVGGGFYAKRMYRNMAERSMMKNQGLELDGVMVEEDQAMPMAVDNTEAPPSIQGGGQTLPTTKDFSPRRNLDETVFFKPHLITDKEGNVVIEFTMNEALTSWKLQLLAHTQDLKSVVDEKTVVTQKDLMVFPQIPRFAREGDKVIVSAKLNKLVDKELSGFAWIEVNDALNGTELTDQLVDDRKQRFALLDENQTGLNWTLDIPSGFIRPIEIIIKARSGKHTDGEAMTIPILTNQILVTETLPISVRANKRRNYTFEALKNAKNTVRPHKLTLEFMENPVWFAVQSMPYLTDYPHKCTEQIAHKLYANAIATHIIGQYPKIQEIFKDWESKEELISNLNKNPELKSALIEETPWLRDAESEEQQMKNIALLFDYERMAGELNNNLDILLSRQMPSGAFNWFEGGREDVYITQLVIEIFGHLKSLQIEIPRSGEWQEMVRRAMQFSLEQMKIRYDRIPDKDRIANYLDATSLHCIYVVSFFRELEVNINFEAWNYYFNNAKVKWPKRSLYEQALLASGFYRFNEKKITGDIVASFKDRALRSEELGMYWKYNTGYYWYNQPIETHAQIMEAIALVDEDVTDMNEMRIWLLKHKQTNRWRSTVSTAKAIYALLLRGEDWLGNTKPLHVQLGEEIVSCTDGKGSVNRQMGTGYFKKSWDAEAITPDMSDLLVKNENNIISWGAVYWQYFQAIDQVEKHTDNPLKIKRGVFKKASTKSGDLLVPVSETELKVGDKVTIRLEFSVDRMMEYIHLKDLRAAGFEPVDVLSGYRWVGGAHFYQSTTDLGTHYFIDRIRAGTYVLEYEAFASNGGDFSGGMSTVQCMYAPEFASHSEGSRIAISR